MRRALLLSLVLLVATLVVFTGCTINRPDDSNDQDDIFDPPATCEHEYDNACDDTCNKCEATRIVGEHDFSEADCVTAKTCKICGATEGEALGHTEEADDGDCTTDVKCVDCGKVLVSGKSKHVEAADDGDCTTPVVCTACPTVLVEAKSHDYATEWTKDATGHWYVCNNSGCASIAAKSAHVSGGPATENSPEQCTVCGYIIAPEIEHIHSYTTPNYDSTNHWIECSCGAKMRVVGHSATDDKNCTTADICSCGYVVVPAKNHVAGEDDGDCTTDIMCKVCGNVAEAGAKNHIAGEDDGDCTTAIVCKNCNHVVVAGAGEHVDADGDTKCDNGGCNVTVESEGPGGDPVIPDEPKTNKEVLIDRVNSVDLYELFEIVRDGVAQYIDFDFHDIKQQLSGTVTRGEHSTTGTVYVNNGMIHSNLPLTEDTDDIYVYVTKDFEIINFYLDANGKWVAKSLGDIPVISNLSTWDFELLDRMVIPTLTEDKIIEKNGKLVVDNSYIVELINANFDLIYDSGYFDISMSKEQAKAELEEIVAKQGLEIAFGVNEEVITSVSISAIPHDKDTTMGYEVELTESGKTLKSLNVYELSRANGIDYMEGFDVEIVTVLDGDTITGVNVVTELKTSEYLNRDYEYANNGYVCNSVVVCSKIKMTASITNIGEDNDTTVTMNATKQTEKVFEVVNTYNYDTKEGTISSTEIDSVGYGSEFNFKLNIARKVAEGRCDMSMEMNASGFRFVAKGTWLDSDTPTFPKLPDEIDNYISGK